MEIARALATVLRTEPGEWSLTLRAVVHRAKGRLKRSLLATSMSVLIRQLTANLATGQAGLNAMRNAVAAPKPARGQSMSSPKMEVARARVRFSTFEGATTNLVRNKSTADGVNGTSGGCARSLVTAANDTDSDTSLLCPSMAVSLALIGTLRKPKAATTIHVAIPNSAHGLNGLTFLSAAPPAVRPNERGPVA